MNKDLFLSVIKNKILFKLVFNKIRYIHTDILKTKVYKWNQLYQNLPLLAYHNYLELVDIYYNCDLWRDMPFKEERKKDIEMSIFICIERNHVELLKYFIVQYPKILSTKYTKDFVTQTRPQEEISSWRYKKSKESTIDPTKSMDLLYYASKHGRFEMVKMLINDSWSLSTQLESNKKNEPLDTIWNYDSAFKVSTLTGNLELVKYFANMILGSLKYADQSLAKKLKHILEVAIKNAFRSGCIDIVEWLLSYVPNEQERLELLRNNANNFIRYAIKGDENGAKHSGNKGGHLDIIKHYYDAYESFELPCDLIDVAAKCNHLEIIKYLHPKLIGRGCTKQSMLFAAENGNLEILQWLHENRTEGCSKHALSVAAANNNMDVLKWLHVNIPQEENFPKPFNFDQASENGSLELMQWLQDNYTDYDSKSSMDMAARYGHLDVVKWLHHHRTDGCTTSAMDKAAWNGHLNVVQWLHENRTEGCTTWAMDYAAERGRLEMVKWLHLNRTEGCTQYAMTSAIQKGRLDMVNWLHRNRTEGCKSRAMDYAIDNDDLDMVKWLHYNRTECSNTQEAINQAVRKNRLKLASWLKKNKPITK